MTRPRRGPTRDGARPRADRFTLQRIARSLTERDQRIFEDLYEHRVLTTTQLFELHFWSHNRARKRLVELYRLGVVWRTRPRARRGSLPFHYVLDELGAAVVAEGRGLEPSELRFRFRRTQALIDSPQLRHLRETNGFFTRLIQACRESQGAWWLTRWWGERRSAERWEGLVRPDGMGRLVGPAGEGMTFALELDRGTEPRGRLETKLERYVVVGAGPGAPGAILFCFRTLEREQRAREVLGGSGLVVATTTQDRHRTDPLGPVWLPVRGPRRVPLMDLGSGAAMTVDDRPREVGP